MSKPKVNLEILKRLVSELEVLLAHADKIQEAASIQSVSSDRVEWVVEMNKASGLAAGIMSEGGLLMGDIQYLVQGGAANPAAKDSTLSLGKILAGLKGSGSAN